MYNLLTFIRLSIRLTAHYFRIYYPGVGTHLLSTQDVCYHWKHAFIRPTRKSIFIRCIYYNKWTVFFNTKIKINVIKTLSFNPISWFAIMVILFLNFLYKMWFIFESINSNVFFFYYFKIKIKCKILTKICIQLNLLDIFYRMLR